jgi:hypothetical protein
VNPKVETVEELQGRRKNLHMGMLKLAREDLVRELTTAHDAFLVPTYPTPPLPTHESHLALLWLADPLPFAQQIGYTAYFVVYRASQPAT